MIKEIILMFCISLLSGVTFIYFWYGSLNLEIVAPKIYITEVINKTVPLILFYTPVFGETALKNGYVSSVLNQCPIKCKVSDDPLLYPESDIALFHSRDMKMNEFLQKHRSQNRLNVFFTTESFANEKIRKKYFPKDFFNVTRTHRIDSEQRIPYGKFDLILPHEKDDDTMVWSDSQVENAIAKKKKLAVIFVSHCITHSFREKLVEDMKRFTNISTFGTCHNSTKFNVTEELDKHFFYLAFENSVCKDYITEKFWRIKDLIVPVVLKRSILKGIIEDEYFIAADDFNSTKELVQKLENVSKNLSEYKKYLGWTKKYKKVSSNEEPELCWLCKMAVNKERHFIPDIYKWWENESKCLFNYLNFTLKYLTENRISLN